jgi:hypothetical protein
MNTSMVKGIVIGGAVALAVGAAGVTGYKTMSTPKFAEVVGVKDVTETIKTPREECQEVEVKKQAPVKDEHRIAGTAIGVEKAQSEDWPKCLILLVGAAGFELATPCTPCKCATRLRYAPTARDYNRNFADLLRFEVIRRCFSSSARRPCGAGASPVAAFASAGIHLRGDCARR